MLLGKELWLGGGVREAKLTDDDGDTLPTLQGGRLGGVVGGGRLTLRGAGATGGARNVAAWKTRTCPQLAGGKGAGAAATVGSLPVDEKDLPGVTPGKLPAGTTPATVAPYLGVGDTKRTVDAVDRTDEAPEGGVMLASNRVELIVSNGIGLSDLDIGD